VFQIQQGLLTEELKTRGIEILRIARIAAFDHDCLFRTQQARFAQVFEKREQRPQRYRRNRSKDGCAQGEHVPIAPRIRGSLASGSAARASTRRHVEAARSEADQGWRSGSGLGDRPGGKRTIA